MMVKFFKSNSRQGEKMLNGFKLSGQRPADRLKHLLNTKSNGFDVGNHKSNEVVKRNLND